MLLPILLALAVTPLLDVDLEATSAGLSGLSRVGATDRYWAVDDATGEACELRLTVKESPLSASLTRVRRVRLKGRKDLEACAYDAQTGWLWVTDESDHSLTAYATSNGMRMATLTLPDYFRACRHNRSLESLSISPDGRELWTANEEPRAGEKFVRIQQFVRARGSSAWRVALSQDYTPDPVVGTSFMGRRLSGLCDLVALGSNRILALERECSVKSGFLPSCRARLYLVEKSGKKLLWEQNTGLANYEAICLGPILKSGGRALILVSDGGNGALEKLLLLRLSEYETSNLKGKIK